MIHCLHASLAPSTQASYTAASCSCAQFAITYNCLAHDESLLPASEGSLMLFATFLASALKPQSIEVYLYGVRNLHLENGFPDPLADALQLCHLLQCIEWLKGAPPWTLSFQSLSHYYAPSALPYITKSITTARFGRLCYFLSLGYSAVASYWRYSMAMYRVPRKAFISPSRAQKKTSSGTEPQSPSQSHPVTPFVW